MRQGGEILRRKNRLLQPVNAIGLEREGVAPGLRRRPGTVRIHHDGNVVAQNLARGGHLGLGNLVQLDPSIALPGRRLASFGDHLGVAVTIKTCIAGDRFAAGGAEQAVQRQAGSLAGDVPERDVQTREGEDGQSMAALEMQLLLQPLVESNDVLRVGAYRQRRDHVLHRRLNRAPAGVAVGFAIAHQTALGLHPHQQNAQARPHLATPAEGFAAVGKGDLQRDGFHGSDFHGLPRKVCCGESGGDRTMRHWRHGLPHASTIGGATMTQDLRCVPGIAPGPVPSSKEIES